MAAASGAIIVATGITMSSPTSNKGRLVLAIFDKPDPLDGPFFEETYYITPSRHPAAVRERVISRVQQACTALGLREGPVHAELRIHDGDGVIMEVASRTIGGDCARLLQFGIGHGLEDIHPGSAGHKSPYGPKTQGHQGRSNVGRSDKFSKGERPIAVSVNNVLVERYPQG